MNTIIFNPVMKQALTGFVVTRDLAPSKAVFALF